MDKQLNFNETNNHDSLLAKKIIELLEFTSNSFDAEEAFQRFAQVTSEFTFADQIVFHRYEGPHSTERMHVFNKKPYKNANISRIFKDEIIVKDKAVGELSVIYFDSEPVKDSQNAFLLSKRAFELIVNRFYERAEIQESQVKTIVSALASDYGNITYVDLVNGTDRIIKANNSGVLVQDDKQKVGYAERVVHYVNEFVVPEEREEMAYALSIPAGIEHTKDGKPYSVSCRIMIDGKIHYRNVKFVPEIEDGKVVALVIGYQSTDQEHMYQEQLEATLEKAEAANKAKTSFLFNMSHDIRTPLNAIIGFTTMAKNHLSEEEKVDDYLDKITTAGDQLLSLINKVLEMSRIESGKVTINNAYFNLNDKIHANGVIFNDLCREKGLDLCISTENIKHDYILSDSDRIDQIINNLLGNAYKYTLKGGSVSLFASQEEGKKPNTCINTIIIKDTGIGMSEEFIGQVFDEFARESSSTISRIEGSGLGMSIVKRVVDLLGGEISVQSKKGKGTTVIFTLETPYQNRESSRNTIESCSNFSIEGAKILLVEDNELNREIAAELLADHGAKVYSVNDGDIAVDKLLTAKPGDFDVVLMDIQMPRMNGYDATRAIRKFANKEIANIPIIAMTANAFEEDRKDAFKAGMNEHLGKPIDIQKTIEVISRFIKK